jgi:hypothetical protein
MNATKRLSAEADSRLVLLLLEWGCFPHNGRDISMFKTFTSVKTLKALIKLSAVALTSPATVTVASSLYHNQPVIKVVVSTAALILVEGCLLLGWEMLDREGKHATMAQLYCQLRQAFGDV